MWLRICVAYYILRQKIPILARLAVSWAVTMLTCLWPSHYSQAEAFQQSYRELICWWRGTTGKNPGITFKSVEVKVPGFLVCDDGVGCIFASLLKPSRLPLIASKASSRLFSPVWVQNNRVSRAQRVSGHTRKIAEQTCCGERFTLGLTLLSSLSFCFCSSNCLLFLSSSSIFCCCSRRFLKGRKSTDII